MEEYPDSRKPLPKDQTFSLEVKPVSASDPLVGLETLVLTNWPQNSPSLRKAYRESPANRLTVENAVRLRVAEKVEAELVLRGQGLTQAEADSQTAPAMWTPPTWPMPRAAYRD